MRDSWFQSRRRMRGRIVYRPSSAYCGGKYRAAKRIRFGSGVCGASHSERKLAVELGCGRGGFYERVVAGRRIYEDYSYAGANYPRGRSVDSEAGRESRSGQARKEGADQSRASLHRVQSLRAGDFAEQGLLLWRGQRFHASGAVGVRHDANHRGRKCDQAGLRMGGAQQTESGAAGGNEWTVRESEGRKWAVDSVDSDDLQRSERAGTGFAARIHAVGRGFAHQAGVVPGSPAIELSGDLSAVFRACELALFVFALDGRPGAYGCALQPLAVLRAQGHEWA